MLEKNEIKALSKTDDELRVGNYIVLYGGRDLEGFAGKGKNRDGSLGEFFSPDVDLESSYTKTGVLHVDWEHGKSRKLDGNDAPGKDDVLGYVDWKTAKRDKIGVWAERVLNRRNRYMQFVETLIEEGLIGNSVETIEEGIEIKSNGEIVKYPLMRDTLTVTPMEPRMITENAIGALKALKILAQDNPSLEALLPEEPGDGSSADATAGKNRADRRAIQRKAIQFIAKL